MITLLASPALAGAWTKELGDGYAKVGAELYAALRYVGPGELGGDGGTYLGHQYGAYGEVGVLPGWKGQVSGSLPLVVGTHTAMYSDPFGTAEIRATTVRTGDLRVALQAAIHPELPLAVAVDLKVPTYANGTVGDAYPVYRELFPKPGDGQIDVGASIYGGLSPWDGGFAEVGVGYVHRTEIFVGWDPTFTLSDGVRFAAKGGHTFGRVLPILAVDGILSPSPTEYTRSAVGLSLSALIDLAGGFAIEPRVAADLWAHNTSQGFGAGIGVSIR